MKTPYKWSIDDYHQMIETGLLQGKPVELLDRLRSLTSILIPV
jgi:hypothetical protein